VVFITPYKRKKSGAFQEKWLRGLRQVKMLKGERVEELKRREKPLVLHRPDYAVTGQGFSFPPQLAHNQT